MIRGTLTAERYLSFAIARMLLRSKEHDMHLSIHLGGNPDGLRERHRSARAGSQHGHPSGNGARPFETREMDAANRNREIDPAPTAGPRIGKVRRNRRNHADAISRADHAGARREARYAHGRHHRPGLGRTWKEWSRAIFSTAHATWSGSTTLRAATSDWTINRPRAAGSTSVYSPAKLRSNTKSDPTRKSEAANFLAVQSIAFRRRLRCNRGRL
jgi:hypothetical protein